MPRIPEQGESGERADRQAIRRALDRAHENTDRPRSRNRRIVALLQELSNLYALDAQDRSARAAS